MLRTGKKTWFVFVALLAGCGGATTSTPDDAGALADGGCSADSGTVPSGDGCNTCFCAEGKWACTDIACPPKPCTPGETTFDGCNTCTCSAEGTWGCTRNACMDAAGPARCGARAGDTCKPHEYCAYQPGEFCGATDIESVCKVRPMACDLKFAPVCGCDRKTYDNTCSAAAAGTGVLEEQPCK